METVEQFQFKSACWFSAGWTLDVWNTGFEVESKLTLIYPGTPEDKWHTESFRAPSASGEVEVMADQGSEWDA